MVRPDGKISLPLINDVQAAGLAALELRDVLTTKFKEFIPSPEVSVIVSEVWSLRFSVIGAIGRVFPVWGESPPANGSLS